jgi:hypothetical protein
MIGYSSYLMIGVAVASLTSCASDRDEPHDHSENGSWSQIVNGLQARLFD